MSISSPRSSVPFLTVFLYSLPPIGCGYMFCLVNLYIMKFSTDVLLIAPAVMGMIFGISRVWDAISDPLAGYLSDRTTSRFGRRRPWMLASTIPIGLSFWMISAPPESLGGTGLILWMAFAVLAFYSAQTIFVVPHMSLGAELTDDYHEKSKVFAGRHAGWIAGYISALLTMYWLIAAEQKGEDHVRALAESQSIIAAFVTAAGLLICVYFLRERPEFAGRGAKKPWRAVGDIWRNEHARLLLVVTFIENMGGAVITILTLYVAEYVIKNPLMAPVFILSYMVFSFLLTPIWAPLARRIGKKRLWIFSQAATAVTFLSMGFLQPGQENLLIFLSAVAGTVGGCGSIINPSIKSDIIDYDEYLTGERKEGAYFAAWNFLAKSAYGVMLAITGVALGWSGFVPKADQTELVENTLRFLYGGVPFIAYMIGALLLFKFKFNEAEHAVVKDALLKARA